MGGARKAVIIAYNGSNYYGFQRQPGVETIEGSIEEVLLENNIISKPFSHRELGYSSASRTDRGVHAIGQVITFIVNRGVSVEEIINTVNNYLGDNIIAWGYLQGVPWDFNARFWAMDRVYLYYLDSTSIPYGVDCVEDIKSRIVSCVNKIRRGICCKPLFFSDGVVLLFSSKGFKRYEIRRIVSCIIGCRELVESKNLVLYSVRYPFHMITYRDVLDRFLEKHSVRLDVFKIIYRYMDFIDWFIENNI